MELKKQFNSFYLFKLAFHSARFSVKRIFVVLSLISLFVAGSLYIANRLYKHTLLFADRTESNKNAASPNNTSKLSATNNKSGPKVKKLSLSAEYWEKRKQNGINQLSSQLHASGSRTRRKMRRVYVPGGWKNEQAEEKLARHKSIITRPDEVAAIRQDQLVFSERSPGDDIPAPPDAEPGFWSEFKQDVIAAIKDILNIIL